jgi:hypothetical protein
MQLMARITATAALLLTLGAAGAQGQTTVVLGVGGGPIFPTKGENSFGSDVKSAGYHGQVMVGFGQAGGKVSVRFDVQYGSVKYVPTTTTKPKDNILAVNMDLVLHPSSSGAVRPYFMAGPTYGHFSYSSGAAGASYGDVTTNNFGFNAGVGLRLGSSDKVWFFTEGRYIYTKEHSYMPLTVGVRINPR